SESELPWKVDILDQALADILFNENVMLSSVQIKNLKRDIA
ncbi:DNA polymerase beta subunit, partial [Acetobacter malorum]